MNQTLPLSLTQRPDDKSNVMQKIDDVLQLTATDVQDRMSQISRGTATYDLQMVPNVALYYRTFKHPVNVQTLHKLRCINPLRIHSVAVLMTRKSIVITLSKEPCQQLIWTDEVDGKMLAPYVTSIMDAINVPSNKTIARVVHVAALAFKLFGDGPTNATFRLLSISDHALIMAIGNVSCDFDVEKIVPFLDVFDIQVHLEDNTLTIVSKPNMRPPSRGLVEQVQRELAHPSTGKKRKMF
jgi:hypothetical protein